MLVEFKHGAATGVCGKAVWASLLSTRFGDTIQVSASILHQLSKRPAAVGASGEFIQYVKLPGRIQAVYGSTAGWAIALAAGERRTKDVARFVQQQAPSGNGWRALRIELKCVQQRLLALRRKFVDDASPTGAFFGYTVQIAGQVLNQGRVGRTPTNLRIKSQQDGFFSCAVDLENSSIAIAAVKRRSIDVAGCVPNDRPKRSHTISRLFALEHVQHFDFCRLRRWCCGNRRRHEYCNKE